MEYSSGRNNSLVCIPCRILPGWDNQIPCCRCFQNHQQQGNHSNSKCTLRSRKFLDSIPWFHKQRCRSHNTVHRHYIDQIHNRFLRRQHFQAHSTVRVPYILRAHHSRPSRKCRFGDSRFHQLPQRWGSRIHLACTPDQPHSKSFRHKEIRHQSCTIPMKRRDRILQGRSRQLRNLLDNTSFPCNY
jgi:hypothetical protein